MPAVKMRGLVARSADRGHCERGMEGMQPPSGGSRSPDRRSHKAGPRNKALPMRQECRREHTSVAAPITPVTVQPSTLSDRGMGNLPMILRLLAGSMISTIIGTATTPLITALQYRILMGYTGVKLISIPVQGCDRDGVITRT